MLALVQPVYAEGQLVHYIGDPVGINGTVQERHWNDSKGWSYKVSSVQMQMETRTLEEGFMIIDEAELVAVEAE